MNRKIINYNVKGKKVFVGLENSKRTRKISVRCGKRDPLHFT